MAKHKSNTDISKLSTPIVDSSQQFVPAQLVSAARVSLPLRYIGGDLGLGNVGAPTILFEDAAGIRFETSSVEWALRNIELFVEGRDQVQLLAAAALHYGLDAYGLMGADMHSMWRVCDATGRTLVSRLSFFAASDAAAEYMRQPDWVGEVRIKREDSDDGMLDPRHEGPLVLLHHNLGFTSFEGVAVKSQAGRCGMMLEEVLWRFDQFGADDQAVLMRGLAKHFDLMPRTAGQRQQGVAA